MSNIGTRGIVSTNQNKTNSSWFARISPFFVWIRRRLLAFLGRTHESRDHWNFAEMMINWTKIHFNKMELYSISIDKFELIWIVFFPRRWIGRSIEWPAQSLNFNFSGWQFKSKVYTTQHDQKLVDLSHTRMFKFKSRDFYKSKEMFCR